MTDAVGKLAGKVTQANQPAVDVPECSFLEFLGDYATVRLRDGSYARYSFDLRRPLIFVAQLLDKITRNTVHGEVVEIDGAVYQPGTLKGSTVSVCGGAQFGKTVLELNFGGWLTTIEFLNFGYYTSDLSLLATIVDTKFRPDVVDQIAWMPDMIDLNKGEGKSGRSVNRKNAFQVSDGQRRAFGYFNGMQRPPTTISLDVAVLDEVDDIPEKNIGFISGRMTNSNVQLTCYIGTQRIHAAGQNARWTAGTMHKWMTPCSGCGQEVCIEEHWPGVCRIAVDGKPSADDPKLDERMTFDPDVLYYPACPDCGTRIDSDQGRYSAEHPERAQQRNWSVRIAQMDVPAIPWRDLVASWFSALADPNPGAIAGWHCDRRAIPHAGAAQPITPAVLQGCRALAYAENEIDAALAGSEETPGYSMALGRGDFPRVAGMDTGPRCWIWVDEVRSPLVSALTWAEMCASENAFGRVAQLFDALGLSCIFIDAGGEPDLTKRLVLALNGLDEYDPPLAPRSELLHMQLRNIGAGVEWNGEKAQWRNIKAAAVDFSKHSAAGVEQTIGFTQSGKIYPLIKCNRAESIQGAVNDFLTPREGFLEHVDIDDTRSLRVLPRQRLPQNAIGPGVTMHVLDSHLQNMRRIKDPRTNREDWADGVENHLGLAKVYARLAAIVGLSARSASPPPTMPHAFERGRRAQAIKMRRERGVLA
ncbi:MAG: phage terminase large subunit family protein [Lentisphaerae bacterium]|nr:phage terminase large subunit family protein [Lentisphaerota bacterium]